MSGVFYYHLCLQCMLLGLILLGKFYTQKEKRMGEKPTLEVIGQGADYRTGNFVCSEEEVRVNLGELLSLLPQGANPNDYQVVLGGLQSVIAPKNTDEGDIVFAGGRLHIDTLGHTFQVDSVNAELTFTEFQMVKYLGENAGTLVPKGVFSKNIWGYSYPGRTIDVHMGRIRSKIGTIAPDLGGYQNGAIQTVRNVGYIASA